MAETASFEIHIALSACGFDVRSTLTRTSYDVPYMSSVIAQRGRVHASVRVA